MNIVILLKLQIFRLNELKLSYTLPKFSIKIEIYFSFKKLIFPVYYIINMSYTILIAVDNE